MQALTFHTHTVAYCIFFLQVPNASTSTFSVTASLRRPTSAKPKLSVKKQQQRELEKF